MTQPHLGPPRDPRAPIVWLLGIAATLTVVYLFRGLTVPFLLAAVVAYLLSPLVTWADAFAIRRSVAVVGLYLAIGAVLVGGGLVLGPRLRAEAVALAGNLPSLAERVEDAIGAVVREAGEGYPAVQRLLSGWQGERGWIERFIEGRAGNLAEILGHAGTVVFVAVLVPLFAFFLLRDSRRVVALLMDRLPAASIETSVAVWCEIDGIIGRYLRGLALDGIAVGTLTALGLWALGIPYPLLIGAFTGLANAVPFLGPLLGAAAASLVALTHSLGFGTLGWILLLFIGIRLLDDTVISVQTIGRSVHLHPMLVLAAVIAGDQAFGILGMVVAVPTVTALKEVARLFLEHRRGLTRVRLAPTAAPSTAPHYVC